jgi:hypothetical protein
MSSPSPSPLTSPPSADGRPVRVSLISGQRVPYDMFDVDGVDGSSVRVRGPLLLEIGEELSLRIERGTESAVVQARVIGHDADGTEAVTTLGLLGDPAVVRRLLQG